MIYLNEAGNGIVKLDLDYDSAQNQLRVVRSEFEYRLEDGNNLDSLVKNKKPVSVDKYELYGLKWQRGELVGKLAIFGPDAAVTVGLQVMLKIRVEFAGSFAATTVGIDIPEAAALEAVKLIGSWSIPEE